MLVQKTSIHKPLLYPLAVGMFLFLQWFVFQLDSLDFSIDDPRGVLIGQLMAYNVDVSHRLGIYFSLLITAIGCLAIPCFLYRRLGNQISQELWAFLGTVSGIGCGTFFFMPFTDSRAGTQFALVLFTTAVFKIVLQRFFPRKLELKRLIWIGAISLISAASLGSFLDSSFYISDGLAVFWLVLMIIDHFVNLSVRKAINLNLFVVLIFVFLALFIEYNFLREISAETPGKSIIKIIFLLLVLSLGTRIWARYMLDQPKADRLIVTRAFGLMLCLVFASYYTPFVSIPDDQFELANVANSYMRFFRFGEWPFTDFISSHMLYDQLPAYIYGWVHGYDTDLGFLTYSFIYFWISYACIFWYLIYHFNKVWWTFVLLLLFPFFKAALPFSPILIGVILLHKSLYQSRFRDFFILGGFSVFLFFWKLDLGVGNLMMVFTTLIIYALKKGKEYNWKVIFKAITSWLLITLVLFILLCIESGSSYIFTQLTLLWDYIGAHSAHGLPDITYRLDLLYYFHYLVLPVLVLVIAAYTILRGSERKLDVSIIALSVFYFANFQRGLVRHSLSSYTDNYLSSFGIFIIILFLTGLVKKKYAYISLVIGLTVGVPLTEYGVVDGQKALYQRLAERLEHKEDDELSTDSRVKIDSPVPYLELKQFMDSHYRKESSFLDMTNHPMSYFYTQRRPPSYFNQYLQNTVTQRQQEINLDRLISMDIPVVMYRSSIPEWLDQTDGIPNHLRYQHVSKYVHNHYAPYKIMDGKWIWLLKNDPLLADAENFKISYANNLGHIPGILAKQMSEEKFSTFLKIDSLDILCRIPECQEDLYLQWATDQGPIGEHRLEIRKNDALIADFLFRSDAKRYQTYLLPLDWMAEWALRNTQDSLSFSFTDAQVKQVQILRKEK